MKVEKVLKLPNGRALQAGAWICGRATRERQRLPFQFFDFGVHAQAACRDFGWAASLRAALLSCGVYVGTYRHPKRDKG